jgi:hypothetical protein
MYYDFMWRGRYLYLTSPRPENRLTLQINRDKKIIALGSARVGYQSLENKVRLCSYRIFKGVLAIDLTSVDIQKGRPWLTDCHSILPRSSFGE